MVIHSLSYSTHTFLQKQRDVVLRTTYIHLTIFVSLMPVCRIEGCLYCPRPAPSVEMEYDFPDPLLHLNWTLYIWRSIFLEVESRARGIVSVAVPRRLKHFQFCTCWWFFIRNLVSPFTLFPLVSSTNHLPKHWYVAGIHSIHLSCCWHPCLANMIARS